MKEENVNKFSSLRESKDVFSCSYAGKCIRRILLIVCAVMLFSINSQAQTLKTLSTYFSGKGTGTLVDPYQISTANDLEYLAVVCWTRTSFASTEQTNYETSGKYFQLQNDIDLSSSAFSTNFLPIGGLLRGSTTLGQDGTYAFRGTFDGNGKVISNINITVPETTPTTPYSITVIGGATSGDYTYYYYLGNDAISTGSNNTLGNKNTTKALALFGTTLGATITNLGVKHVRISGKAGNYSNNRAGIAGFISKTTITNCYVEDIDLTSSSSYSNYTFRCTDGGLFAYSGNADASSDRSIVTNCYVKDAKIEGGNSGCFAGYPERTNIYNCYVSGNSNIYSTATERYAGAFCGCSNGKSSTDLVVHITNSYTTATKTGNGCIYNFYEQSSCTNCYYLANADGATTNGLTPKTSATMQSNTFANTTMNSGTLPTGVIATAYKQDYSTIFKLNDGYPIFNTQTNDPYTIANGKELIIPSTTTDASTIPSTITIKDGGSLINNGDASLLTGKTINVERQLKVGAWNLFGLAQNTTTSVTGVLNANAGTTTNTAHNMAAVKYNYNNNTWNTTTYLGANAGTGYTNLNIGEGYFVYPLNEDISGNAITDNYTIVSQTVTPYTSDVNINTLTNNGSASTSGTGTGAVTGKWFALSNPFIGKISVSKLCSSIGNEQGESAIYTYNATEGKWEIPTYVYPGQGFMVASATQTEGGSDYYTSLTGSIQTSNQGAKSNVEEETPSYITFTTSANNTTKEAFARISERASNGFDEKDAYVLLSSNNEDLVEPYFLVDNHAIMKNIYKTMPYVSPINFHASKVSNTSLTVSNIPNNVSVSIVDLSNGQETALDNGSTFNFVANQGENEGRFVVKFGKKSVSIEDNAQENNISLSMYPNPATSQTTLVLDGVNGNAQVLVNDVQGRVVNTYNLANGQTTLKINTNSLASGVYYVRVITNNIAKTEKLIIK